MNPRILGADDVAVPQHMEVLVTDRRDLQSVLRMTIYTGTMKVFLGAGRATHFDQVRCPLIGLVDPLPGTKAILPFALEEQFQGPVATASIGTLITKDDDTTVSVQSAVADLCNVTIGPKGKSVPA